MINYEKAKINFEKYVNALMYKSFDSVGYKDTLMTEVLKYSYQMVNDGTKIMQELNIHPSIQELGKIVLLNHDIGKFLQIRLMGNLDNKDLFCALPVNNHAKLGKMMLGDLFLRYQIPKTDFCDDVIREVTEKHVDYQVSDEELGILSTNILQDTQLKDIFKNGDQKIKKQLIGVFIQIIQDVNELEVVNKILLQGHLNPVSEKTINFRVWEKFINGERIDINELLRDGLWNSNIYELVYLSFIDKIKLLATAQMIEDENLILKLKEKTNNSATQMAYDIANKRLALLIKNSDGVIVNDKRISLK